MSAKTNKHSQSQSHVQNLKKYDLLGRDGIDDATRESLQRYTETIVDPSSTAMNVNQREAVVQFLEYSPDIFSSQMSSFAKQNLWEELTLDFNAVSQACKNWLQWRKVWLKKPNAPLTKPQWRLLLNFVKKHPRLLFQSVRCDSLEVDWQRKKDLWMKISKTVNSVPDGARKTWRQWRKMVHNRVNKLKKTHAVKRRNCISKAALGRLASESLETKQDYLHKKYNFCCRRLAAQQEIVSCMSDMSIILATVLHG